MAKVSVIVPIYKVEKYIERCARSLFEQTLDDMEFIFVDDCSPDTSLKVLETIITEYENRKNQIRIIHHKQNLGLPLARKTGIENSTGDYIIQCDSDDWVDKSMYEAMYNEAMKSHADAVMCGYQITDGEKSIPFVVCNSLNKKQFIINCLSQKESASLWSKLFKRELFKMDINYPTCGMGEDIALCLQLIFYCNIIAFIPKPYYYYYSNIDSISKNQSENCILSRFTEVFNNVNLLENFFRSKTDLWPDIVKPMDCFKHKQRNLLSPLLYDKKYYEMWKTSFKTINRKVLILPISLREKVLFLLRISRIIKR